MTNKHRSGVDLIIYVFLIIFIFCLIYSPRFSEHNTLHFLFFVSLLLLPFLSRSATYILKKSVVIKFCSIFFLISLYSILIACLDGEKISIETLLMVSIELGFCVIFILSIMKWRKMIPADMLNIIIYAGVIQSLICCAMVVLPEFRNLINDFRSHFWDDRLMGWAEIRMLGYADGLFHTTPIVQAIISIFLIKKAENKPILFFFVITTLVSALLNSRTSFVLWLLCLPFYFWGGSSAKKRIIIFVITIITILFSSVIVSLLNEGAGEAMTYFISGLQSIDSATKGEKEGFFTSLDEFFVFPSGVDFIFGIGTDTYNKILNPEYKGIHSDYGFVNNIWSYGIIGTIFMLNLYYRTIKNCLTINLNFSKLIYYVLLIAFIVGHFKGIITYFNDFTALLLLISSSSILNDNCQNERYNTCRSNHTC